MTSSHYQNTHSKTFLKNFENKRLLFFISRTLLEDDFWMVFMHSYDTFHYRNNHSKWPWKISNTACSYERVDWFGCRHLGFSTQDLGNWDQNFVIYINTPARLPRRKTLTLFRIKVADFPTLFKTEFHSIPISWNSLSYHAYTIYYTPRTAHIWFVCWL